MKRIEQLLSQHPNQERYNYLLQDIERQKLVIYFGVGLSLWEKYKKWVYPFYRAQDLIEKSYKQLQEYYNSYTIDTDTQESMKKVAAILEKGERSNDCLCWGDYLDDAVTELRKIYLKTPLLHSFPNISFKDIYITGSSHQKAII